MVGDTNVVDGEKAVSRPKAVTPEAMTIVHEEALHRLRNRTNKEVARVMAEQAGVRITPEYAGKLVWQEIRRISGVLSQEG